MNTQMMPNVVAGYDIASDLPQVPFHAGHAAHKLVHFRDGIMRQLLREAERTADDTPTDAANVLVALLAALEPDDRDRRALQIAHLAGDCWGYFPQIGEARGRALATLRAVCEDAANAVTHDVREAACTCKPVTKGAER